MQQVTEEIDGTYGFFQDKTDLRVYNKPDMKGDFVLLLKYSKQYLDYERKRIMKYNGIVISVEDIHASRKFYEELFNLKLYQDYGINISFTCGLSLQQEFAWLVNLPKEKVMKKPNNMEIYFEEEDFDGFIKKLKSYPGIEYLGGVIEQGWGQRVIRFYDLDGHIIEVGEDLKMVIHRFLSSGMTMEEVSVKMDVSIEDLTKLLNGDT